MLQAEQIRFLSRGLESLPFTSLSSKQARKQGCTHVDLCTVEAILVHHPVEQQRTALGDEGGGLSTAQVTTFKSEM